MPTLRPVPYHIVILSRELAGFGRIQATIGGWRCVVVPFLFLRVMRVSGS